MRKRAAGILIIAVATGCATNASSPSTAIDGGVPEAGTVSPDGGGAGPAACTTTSLKLAPNAGVMFLVGDTSNLYVDTRTTVATGDAFWRIPKSGGPATAIAQGVASNGKQVQAMALDDQYIYWVTEESASSLSTVSRMPLSGGTPSTLVDNRPIQYGTLVVAAGALFWGERVETDPRARTGRVAKMSVAGGQVEVLATTDRVPWAIAVGGGFAYWTTEGDNNNGSSIGKSLLRAPVGGGPSEKVIDQILDDALATNASSILYLGDDDKIAVLPFTALAPSASVDLFPVSEIAASDTHVYALNGGSMLSRASLDGTGVAVKLAATSNGTWHGILVDERCVYWGDIAEGVFTIQK
ncbi:MAG: hypothetical protein JWM74_5646 [Myxococcaceae bacterium]|nr:hypothetical protein [Myxococcaceae bacterium]